MVSSTASVQGWASGFVGMDNFSASLRQDDHGADLSGTLGGRMVSLHDSISNGSEQINGIVGNDLVSLSVQHDNQGDRIESDISGWVGGRMVSLHESGDSRSTWITGFSGMSNVSITHSGSGNNSVYSGFAGSTSISVSASMSAPGAPSAAVLAVLALGDGRNA